MPNAIWTGSLSFGLVVIPVRLHPAIRKKMVRFHELDSRGRRVRRVRVPDDESEPLAEPVRWPSVGDFSRERGVRTIETPPTVASRSDLPHEVRLQPGEVPFAEIRKGFEVAPGQYVSLTRDEVRQLAPERSRSIDVERFVDAAAVDPIHFESHYYVTPQRTAVTAFQLLKRAMSDANRMAIASFTMRQRQYLAGVRPLDEVMLLTTMVRADEILPAPWSAEAEAEPSERELKMARLLVESMSGPFEPELYTDEHRERLLSAIARKTPAVEPASSAPSPNRVLDLMAALEASVKAARAARRNEAKPQKRPAQRWRSGGARA